MKSNKKILAFFTLVCILLSLCAFTPYGYFGTSVNVSAAERISLIPGGMPFGIKFFTKGVIVIGTTDIETYDGIASPAKDAGIKAGDIITKVNDKEVNTVEELGELINETLGSKTILKVNRNGNTENFTVYPKKSVSDGEYRTGLWVRDSTAGIGTVTYVNASDLSFGGLGHGICDPETDLPLPLLKGVVTNVTVTGVKKGMKNDPGELKGEFSAYKSGLLEKNTECGVFGKLNENFGISGKSMEIAFSSEVKTGKAYILTTIEGSTPSLYEVNITRIYPNSGKTKNFMIEVTDKTLLEKAGGIVQGMSGSPVIQNGRLCGAVTHVMINDPTKGYGIFIENMLEESGKNS